MRKSIIVFIISCILFNGTQALAIDEQDTITVKQTVAPQTVYTAATLAGSVPINQVFPDPNLASYIATLFPGKTASDPVDQAELDTISEISAPNSNITNIEGVQYLNSVTFIELYENQITNLSPLAGLTNLNALIMNHNQITDLSPLTGLTNLSLLDLNSNQISDVSILAGLPAYQNLCWVDYQTITLPTIQLIDNNLIVENGIINFDGQLVTPATITNGGSYTAPNIQWSGLSGAGGGAGEVSYSFNNDEGFSGTVIQPYFPDTTAPTITANDVTYEVGATKTEAEYFIDASVASKAGATIATDFMSVVDLNAAGEYIVTNTATDVAGNLASINVKVTVTKKDVPEIINPVKTGDDNSVMVLLFVNAISLFVIITISIKKKFDNKN